MDEFQDVEISDRVVNRDRYEFLRQCPSLSDSAVLARNPNILDVAWFTYSMSLVLGEPPLFKELSIESKKMFMPYLRAPLGDNRPDEIREALSKFLPEEKQQESFITIISHLVRF